VILERRAVRPFFKNGFVIGCEDTREGVVIDPGDEVDELLAAVAHHKLTIGNILLTHAHLDHVTGVAQAKRALGAPVWLHKDDNSLYEHVVEQGQMFGISVVAQPPIDRFYQGQEPLRFGNYQVRVLHTPGHSPGGVCLVVGKDTKEAKDTKETKDTKDAKDTKDVKDTKEILFVGDTLFAGSIGRTDLQGGNMETLLESIRTVLFAFPDDTIVWSGHGEQTTIGREKRTNPFLIG
jgi:glyoxylase-like metal-dependent hydrolase (beta-lactamase superfamily II)